MHKWKYGDNLHCGLQMTSCAVRVTGGVKNTTGWEAVKAPGPQPWQQGRNPG